MSRKTDAFLEAVEAYHGWEDGTPEPTVEFKDKQITISQACGLVWSCADILPKGAVDYLDNCGIDLSRRTYAAAARVLKPAIANAESAR
jgi:hypothetical protein